MSERRKRGRLSPAEKKFIADHAALMSPEAIAAKLNRRPDTITEFIRPTPDGPGPVVLPRGEVVKEELRTSAAWKRLKDEFDKEELDYFTERYAALMLQFRDDVLATEENQIMKAIKYELLMSRNLIERKRLRAAIENLDRMQSRFLTRFKSPAEMSETDKLDAVNMANQLSNMRAAEQSKYNEYTTLDKQHQQLMKDLKATRDQRLNRASDGKKNFLDFIKMLQEEDVKDREGRQMAFAKKAHAREVGRLGQYHTYSDGAVDKPVLNADTAIEGE